MTTGQPCRDGRICDIVTCHDPAPSCEVYGENLEEKIAKAVESRVACQDIFLVVSPLGNPHVYLQSCLDVWNAWPQGWRAFVLFREKEQEMADNIMLGDELSMGGGMA